MPQKVTNNYTGIIVIKDPSATNNFPYKFIRGE